MNEQFLRARVQKYTIARLMIDWTPENAWRRLFSQFQQSPSRLQSRSKKDHDKTLSEQKYLSLCNHQQELAAPMLSMSLLFGVEAVDRRTHGVFGVRTKIRLRGRVTCLHLVCLGFWVLGFHPRCNLHYNEEPT